jgi:CRP-like cAMP-binding protein
MKEFDRSRLGSVATKQVVSVDNTRMDGSLALLPELRELPPAPPVERRIQFNGRLTNRILATLPGSDFARLLPHMEAVSLAASQTIYGFGENVNFAYFPETAVITHLYVLEDGSTTAAALIGNEGMIGLSAVFAAAPQSYATQITIAGEALRIDIETLRQEFIRGGAIQQALLKYTTARLAQLSQKAVCNGRHRLDERLCTWLLMVHDRAGQNHLCLTHEQIAHQLGARRAGVTDACNVLRKNGAIHYRRGAIRISDRLLLETAACECYGSFKQTGHNSSTFPAASL